MKKRVLTLLLSIILVITTCSNGFCAQSTENSDKRTVTVFFSLSEDGKFVTGNDANETVLAHIPVTISYFDLAEYGMENYYRYESDSFENGGEYINDKVVEQPTLLHLFIKMLEKYYLGDGRKLVVNDKNQDAMSISGAPTSLYMTRFWGHDENLMYYINHKYPLQAAGSGSTSDYILLEDGMEIDVAMFSDWDFYHTGAFSYFTGNDISQNDLGQYEVEKNQNLTLTMRATATNAAYDGNSSFSGEPMPQENVVTCRKEKAVSGYSNDNWNEDKLTDENGNITLSFSEPGTYYVSSTPLYKNYQLESGNACVAPPIAVVYVNGEGEESTDDGESYNGKLVSDITVLNATAASAKRYLMDTNFSNDKKSYNVTVGDYENSVCVEANLVEQALNKTTLRAEYEDITGEKRQIEIKSGDDVAKKLLKIIDFGTGTATFKIIAECKNADGSNVTETYNFNIIRQSGLADLVIKDGNSQNILKSEFKSDTYTYSVNVTQNTKEIYAQVKPFKDEYAVLLNGEPYDFSNPIKLKAGDLQKESFDIEVSNQGCVQSTYHIDVNKTKLVSTQFLLNEGSILQIKDLSGRTVKRYCGDSEIYTVDQLNDGENYDYTVTKYGYRTKTGSFVAKEMLSIDGRLAIAPENMSIDKNIGAQWKNFRGNDENNGITNALTPIDYKNAQLYWAKKVGTGYGSGAPSSPILVDDCLVYTTATSIVKVDTMTGEVVASGKMVKTSAFNITPPTYADGMIFVALASGTIQAFNAETLESLWVYDDALYGQPNSPITYHNGYIYTGFWNGETGNANYVCISVTDEDVNNDKEAKQAAWTYTVKGGFYWAGSYVSDKYGIVGTDDGEKTDEEGKSSVLVFNPLTGEIIDKYSEIAGDTRSTISYDGDTDSYCFTSKGGYFYSMRISGDGHIDNVESINLGGASTSTPVVCNKRAYVGVKGSQQFGANSGHRIAVIDMENMQVAYELKTRGYPQTSGMATTGYEQREGYTYVYFVDNYEPGKVRVLKDRPGQTEAIITRKSEYDDDSDNNVLFSPKGEQANYAICSLISDCYGTIYFKNDSAYMMALGSRIEKIEVTKQPDKTNYREGEKFDATGMEVTAYYSNGNKRDITKYVTCNNEKLTEDMSDIEIRFPYVMYNDTLKNYEKFDPLLDTVEITVNTNDGVQKAEQVVKKIDEIGSTITLDSKEKIKAARKSYDALTSSEEVYVTNYSKLLAAENTFKELVKTEFDKNKIKLNAKEQKQSFVSISFNKNKYADGYIIYRWNEESKKYEKIKTLTATGYKDKNVKIGNTYSYKVEQYVEMGPFGKTIISSQSNTCKVNITLEKPKLIGKSKLKKATVKWKKNAKASGYEIFRKTGKKGKYKKIKTIKTNKTTKFTDTKIKKKKTYYYKIRAYRTVSKKKVYSEFSKNCKY